MAFEEIDEDADAILRDRAWEEFVAELFAAGDPRVVRLADIGIHLGHLKASFKVFAAYPDVEEWPAPEVRLGDLVPARQALERYLSRIRAAAADLPRGARHRPADGALREHRAARAPSRSLAAPSTCWRCSRSSTARTAPFRSAGRAGPKAASRPRSRPGMIFRDEVAGPFVARWREMRYAAVIPLLQAAVAVYDRLRFDAGVLNFQDLLLEVLAAAARPAAGARVLPPALHAPVRRRVPGHRPAAGRGRPVPDRGRPGAERLARLPPGAGLAVRRRRPEAVDLPLPARRHRDLPDRQGHHPRIGRRGRRARCELPHPPRAGRLGQRHLCAAGLPGRRGPLRARRAPARVRPARRGPRQRPRRHPHDHGHRAACGRRGRRTPTKSASPASSATRSTRSSRCCGRRRGRSRRGSVDAGDPRRFPHRHLAPQAPASLRRRPAAAGDPAPGQRGQRLGAGERTRAARRGSSRHRRAGEPGRARRRPARRALRAERRRALRLHEGRGAFLVQRPAAARPRGAGARAVRGGLRATAALRGLAAHAAAGRRPRADRRRPRPRAARAGRPRRRRPRRLHRQGLRDPARAGRGSRLGGRGRRPARAAHRGRDALRRPARARAGVFGGAGDEPAQGQGARGAGGVSRRPRRQTAGRVSSARGSHRRSHRRLPRRGAPGRRVLAEDPRPPARLGCVRGGGAELRGGRAQSPALRGGHARGQSARGDAPSREGEPLQPLGVLQGLARPARPSCPTPGRSRRRRPAA